MDPLPIDSTLPDLRRALRDPILLTSLRTRLAIVLGVVFLMTVKPSSLASVVVIILAAAIGLLASQIPARRSQRELRNEIG